MEVSIPRGTTTTTAPAQTDEPECQLVLSIFPDVPSDPPSSRSNVPIRNSLQGTKNDNAAKGDLYAAEKHGSASEQEVPFELQEHPLFPPLPAYGPPTIASNIKYYVIQVVSFALSLCFLTAIFVGALSRTAGTVLVNATARLRGRKPASERVFKAEEEKRRVSRAESDRKWEIRQQKKHVDEEQGSDECPPLEGGKDAVVCDVAYYARRVGLDVETFRVQTEDGFIITLWHVFNPQQYAALPAEQRRERGPAVFTGTKSQPASSSSAKRRYPVLLIHGLLQSAGAYCTNNDDSLAFFLCKSGYDVWLGNNRCGMTPEHTTLSPSDPRMWSWDIRHLGTLDLAALTSRVLYETGFEKLGLVCHSQGTAETFVALAKEHRPELGERISVFCALAPAAYAGPLVGRSYFRFMSIMSSEMFRVFFGIHAFIPFMMTVQRTFHPKLYGTLAYCVFSFLFDWSDCRWEQDLRDRMFQFAPVYVSAEIMRWWLGSDGFAKHKCILSTEDQSASEAKVDNRDPEDVDLVHGDDPGDPCLAAPADKAWFGPQVPPFALWVGGSDALVDGRRLLQRFEGGLEPHVRVVHSKVIEEYEHLDFLWAMDAVEQVGKEVRQVIWNTMPDEARDLCRVPRGVNETLIETGRNNIT
ncbi:putative ab-hydrolase associated lipase [Penicillium brasilianum]|uniref:Putative ab-hydrolase associated lipase n=1 Tax=Penicillium brasilianum TaxID=104259 RepID=A0A1S9RF21_PENBI|nr:putative ab-hydrolase associated lipase [Penicillium brasilianum]